MILYGLLKWLIIWNNRSYAKSNYLKGFNQNLRISYTTACECTHIKKMVLFRINIVFTTVVFEIRTRPNYWLIIEWNDNKARLGMQSKLSKILAKIHIKQCMFEGLGVAIYWKRVEVFSQWNVITKHTDTARYVELFEQKCRMI